MNYSLQNLTVKFTAILFVLFFIASGTFGQETSDTPAPSATPSEMEKRLEEEKRIKTLQKDIAEADKAIRDSKPQPKTTPLEGKTELTDVKIETDIVTYQAVSTSLGRIADTIRQKAPDAGMIILYNQQDMANLDAYEVNKKDIKGQITNLKDRYEKIRESYDKSEEKTSNNLGVKSLNFLGALAAGADALGLVTDLLAVFRTDTTITGQTVNVGESAMVSRISQIFSDRSLPVYYPQKYFPITNAKNAVQSDFFTMMTQLDTAKTNAEQKIFEHQFYIDALIANQTAEKSRLQSRIASIDKFIAELVTARAGAKTLKEKKQFQTAINEQEKLKIPIESAIEDVDQKLFVLNTRKFHMDKLREINNDARTFINGLTASTDGKPSKLISFLRAERMRGLQNDLFIKQKNYYWLEMEAVSAGGNNRTRKNLILYFTGAKVDHSGGVIIAWKLYNPDGSIKYSGIDQQYDGYKSPKTIKTKQPKPASQQTPGTNNQVGGND